MNVRYAKLQDLPAIVSIYNSTIPGRLVTADTEAVSVESRVQWLHNHSARRPLWIVEENDQTIGWVSFGDFYGRPAYNATAEISIYLAAVHRGKGWGKKILAHAIGQCPGLQIKTLLGYIFAHNENSLKLFRQAGFEDWAMLPDIAMLDAVERSLVIVGKRIER